MFGSTTNTFAYTSCDINAFVPHISHRGLKVSLLASDEDIAPHQQVPNPGHQSDPFIRRQQEPPLLIVPIDTSLCYKTLPAFVISARTLTST
mmetsp:Transcript_42525/g.51643  ORF Transcript_42525/g.51643 Transcript_42525/m.51643 type:complete len:92 (+) Transcript_42525:135-410(+)